MTAGIRIDSVSLTLGDHRVFTDLDMHMSGGQWHAVLGRSGIGKSTLVRLLAGIQQADQGTVNVNTDDDKPLQQRVAYMAQDDGLLPWLSVIDNVQLGPKLRGEKSENTTEAATLLLQQTGMPGWESALPRDLSGGMRQRAALARTLLEDQPVVLMDEPFSRLDAITRDELQNLAHTLLESKTVVLITHDPVEALRLAGSVHILHGGHPTQIDSLALAAASQPRNIDDPQFVEKLAELWSLMKTTEPVAMRRSA